MGTYTSELNEQHILGTRKGLIRGSGSGARAGYGGGWGCDGEGIWRAEVLSLPSGKVATIAGAYVDTHDPDTSSFKFHYKITRERTEDSEGGLHVVSTSQTFATRRAIPVGTGLERSWRGGRLPIGEMISKEKE